MAVVQWKTCWRKQNIYATVGDYTRSVAFCYLLAFFKNKSVLCPNLCQWIILVLSQIQMLPWKFSHKTPMFYSPPQSPLILGIFQIARILIWQRLWLKMIENTGRQDCYTKYMLRRNFSETMVKRIEDRQSTIERIQCR